MINKLIEIVNASYGIVSKRIQEDPDLVFSEADFERLITNEIEHSIIENEQLCSLYSVHNQVSHYCEEDATKPNYRVDILIMEKSKIKECIDIHKSFVYGSSENTPTVAIELKYYRVIDSISTIENDINKVKNLVDNNSAHLFVIAVTSNPSQNEKIEKIFVKHKKDKRLTTLVFSKIAEKT